MDNLLKDEFPLRKTEKIKGTRRLVREKVLQIINAKNVSKNSYDELFEHIFYRIFNFDENTNGYNMTASERKETPAKFLSQEEILEADSDMPVVWKEADIEFGKHLINVVISQNDEINEMIEKYSANWKLDRIAQIDKILIHIAAAEFTEFPEIPEKVSINESLEIAKLYSTDKSSIFINGILDSIRTDLQNLGKITKIGRGLNNK